MRFVIIFLLFINGIGPTFAQDQSASKEFDCSDYRRTDEELNVVYKSILEKYKNYDLFKRKLKIAQKAWLVYRDAELEAIYPEENKLYHYGSVNGLCECLALDKMTKKRIEELKWWLEKPVEGEVCSGSQGRIEPPKQHKLK